MKKQESTATILILDTCTWCNFIQDRKWDFSIFSKLSQLIKEKEVFLFVPEQVKVEWDRNREKVVKELETSVKSTLDQAKSLSKWLPEHKQEDYIRRMQDTEFHINVDARNTSMMIIIDDLIKNYSIPITLEDAELKELVIKFGLDGKRPFTKKKNSTGDAVIFFSIYDHFKNKEKTKYKAIHFITSNTEDFSKGTQGKASNEIHEDLKPFADEIGLQYSTNIAKTINSVHNNLIDKAIEEGIEQELYYKYTKNPKCPKCSNDMLSQYIPTDTFGVQQWIHKCFDVECGHVILTEKTIDVSGM